MRFSTWRMSISVSSWESQCSRRCLTSNISGSFSICRMLETQPVEFMAPGPGSSLAADFWATSNMLFPASIAVSIALMDFGRPTNSGITMWGNTTTSRSGSSGYWTMSADGTGSDMLVRSPDLLESPLKCGFPPENQWSKRTRTKRVPQCRKGYKTCSWLPGSASDFVLVRVNQERLAVGADHRLVDHHLADIFQRW